MSKYNLSKKSTARYTLLLLFIFAVHLLSACNNGQNTTKESKKTTQKNDKTPPNVLFIAIDDLRPELGCYGHPQVKSPNIDALAQEGVLFNRAYCQQAICTPSRTSLMTGLRPDATKTYFLKTHFRTKIPNVVTLSQYFAQNGYVSTAVGKIYHSQTVEDSLSWSQPSWWPKRGRSRLNYQRPENQEASPRSVHHGGRPAPIGPAYEKPVNHPDIFYKDGMIAQKAIERMRELKDEPFFLGVGFIRPHLPFVAPKKYWDMYDSTQIKLPPTYVEHPSVKPPAMNTFGELRKYINIDTAGYLPDSQALRMIHGYYACVSFVDVQVGKVLKELKNLGLEDNTIIVLWGDHGWKLGDYKSWCKHTNFEVDTRSPLIIKAPNTKPKGKISNAIVEFVDIYPTLCELAGLDIPKKLQGESMVRLLKHPGQKGKVAAFSQYPRSGYMGYTMRTDSFRYTQWINRSTKKMEWGELYDHKTDPIEMQNKIDDPSYKSEQQYLDSLLTANIKTW